jgi:hypothetical protein
MAERTRLFQLSESMKKC